MTTRTEAIVTFSIADLLHSWDRSLRSARLSPRTIDEYLKAARRLGAFLAAQGMPTAVGNIRREHVEAFIVHELGRVSERTGKPLSPSSAASSYRRLQQLFKWLTEEGEIIDDPMARMRPPAVGEAPVEVIPLDDLRAIIDACAGNEFVDRRDAALIRLLADSGARLAEVTNIAVVAVDWQNDMIRVVGKGDKSRDIPFGAKTGKALDRYVRARRRHPHAQASWLWLGLKGKLTESGISQMLERRAKQAGISHVHAHQFRHTMSHRWLAAGGNEGDLMQVNGWSSRDMLARYGRSAAAERARKAHRRLALGDTL